MSGPSRWAASSGSSPLARGLPPRYPRTGRSGGIIPARAGFTSRRWDRRSAMSDHPRSRGVYLQQRRSHNGRSGSSPLARGLPSEDMAGFLREGIIPARAGFTPAWCPHARWAADHPRSRGVYDAENIFRVSPPWIIPARAGFTGGERTEGIVDKDHPRSRGVYWWTCTAGPPPMSDHPRSRGVYDGTTVLASVDYGSSPLARGLRGLAVRIVR